MATGKIPEFLARRLSDGFTKSEYAIPKWIGGYRARTLYDNEIMWWFYYSRAIIASTRLEF